MIWEGFFRKEKTENSESSIESLNLKIGSEISLTKLAKSANAEIQNGEKFQGPLLKDVALGRPIDIRGFSTSPIRDVREDNGKYYVVTQNSLYELSLVSAPKNQEAKVQTPEALIQSLGLKKGNEITVQKINKDKNSNVEVGVRIQGRLHEDVAVGEPLLVGNLRTSVIREIRQEQGRYFLVTQTSLYELFPTGEQAKQPERAPSIPEILQKIENNMEKQPLSIRENWQEIKKNIVKVENIQGLMHVFSAIAMGSEKPEAMALVQSQSNPEQWKMRVFRFSESDHQWKSFPGKRMDGSFLKGEEWNPLHHYVQSAKLHKDVYLALEALPITPEDPRFDKFLPVETNGNGGRYEEELEFTEKHQQLKNPEWAKYQYYAQSALKAYDTFVSSAKSLRDFTRDGKLYKTLEGLERSSALFALKKTMDALNDSTPDSSVLRNMSLSNAPREFRDVYQQQAGAFVESLFTVELPKSMMPDFSPSAVKARYEKKDIQRNGKEKIMIEEYEVRSPEGDQLIFAMAHDSKGRVYVDNIYDPRSAVTDYGTMDTITQMGYLIYKPEDYRSQAQFGLPDKYKKPVDRNPAYYVDISALWENLPILQQYKKELRRRGTLK